MEKVETEIWSFVLPLSAKTDTARAVHAISGRELMGKIEIDAFGFRAVSCAE